MRSLETSGAVIAAAFSVAAGLAIAALGVWLIRSSEVKEGDTSFVRAWSPRSLKFAGGWLMLFTGLFVTAIVAPMLYLTPTVR